MSLSLQSMLQLSIILPVLATLGIVATGRKPNLREAVTLTTSLVLLYFFLTAVLGTFSYHHLKTSDRNMKTSD